jgi:hypothetical protein
MVMTAKYSVSSPWYSTKIKNNSLSVWVPRTIPARDDDFEYTILPQYNYRPDLLAYDLYGNPRLWWVFMQRNTDVLFDPIFDFRAGTTIKLPKKSALLSALGIN